MTPLKDLLTNLSVRAKTPRHLRHLHDNDDNESIATSPNFTRVQRQLFNLRPSSCAEETRPSTSHGHSKSHSSSLSSSLDRIQQQDSRNSDGSGDENGNGKGKSREKYGHAHTESQQPLLLAGPEYASPRTTTPFFSPTSPTSPSNPNPFFSPSPATGSTSASPDRERGRFTPDPRTSTLSRAAREIRRSTKTITRSNSVPSSRRKRSHTQTPNPGLVVGQGTPIRPPRPEVRAKMQAEAAKELVKDEIMTIEEALASPPLPASAMFDSRLQDERQEDEQGLSPRVLFPEQSPRRLEVSPTRSGYANSSTSTTPRQTPLKLRLKMKSSNITIKPPPSSTKPGLPPVTARGPGTAERVPNAAQLDEWWNGLDGGKKMAAKEIFESLTGLFDSTYPCLIPKDAEEGVYRQEGVYQV